MYVPLWKVAETPFHIISKETINVLSFELRCSIAVVCDLEKPSLDVGKMSYPYGRPTSYGRPLGNSPK